MYYSNESEEEEQQFVIDLIGNIYLLEANVCRGGLKYTILDGGRNWTLTQMPIDKTFEFVLTQFTGIKDKNGKEIYEGDILLADWNDKRYKPCITTVEWDEKEFCYYFSTGSVTEAHWSHEVIGNIYENPELIK